MKEERTARGIKRCAEWLKFCLQLGWDKKSLDGLEELWWKHHDGNGNLIRPAAAVKSELEQNH